MTQDEYQAERDAMIYLDAQDIRAEIQLDDDLADGFEYSDAGDL